MYVHLLRGQNKRLQYKSLLDPSCTNASTQIWLFSFESKYFYFRKSLLDPSCMNASTQIWLFSFESKCFYFRMSSLLPKCARNQECSVRFSFSYLWPRIKILILQNDFSLSSEKDVIILAPRSVFFFSSAFWTGAPLDCNQIWQLIVHF